MMQEEGLPAIFARHARMAQDGRFDPRTEAYYDEMSRRLAPHLVAAGVKESPEPAPRETAPLARPSITAAVAGVTRASPGATSATKVKLTPYHVKFAQENGISLQQMAAEVLKIEERERNR